MFARIKPYLTYRYLLYFFALNAGWPSVLSFMGWLPEFRVGYIILTVLAFVYVIRKGGKVPSPIIAILCAQALCFSVYYIIYNDSSYLTRCFFLLICFFLLSIQMGKTKMEFLDTYVGWLSLQAFMGGIGFILVIMGVLRPLSTFREFDGHIGEFYGLFTTTVSTDSLLRVAGFFDEPGAFAFWGFIALLVNKLFYENKKVERVLLLGLISTLSMAYYIQLAFYAFFFYKNKISKLILPLALFLGLLSVIASYSPEMHDAIYGRFQYNKTTGTLQGDNRTEHAAVCLDIWKSSPIIGVGASKVNEIGDSMGVFVGANHAYSLAQDGLLGQIFLWLPLLYIFKLGAKQRKFRYASYLLFIGFLQRPYDSTQLLYPLILLSIGVEAYRGLYLYTNEERSDFSVKTSKLK